MKRFVALLSVVVIFIALAGCTSSPAASGDTSFGTSVSASSEDASNTAGDTIANPKRTYYYCGTLNAHPYFNDVYLGIKYACNIFNCDVIKVGPDNIDPVAQSEGIEQCIAKNPDGIITILYDSSPLPAIKKAMEADIPVVIIEANIEGDNGALAYVGMDNYDFGYQVGVQLLKQADGGKVVAVGNWGATNTDQNLEGFLDAIEGSGWELIGKVDDKAQSETAIEAAKSAINNYPEMTAMVGMDSSSGGGIAAALEELGKKPGEYIVCCKDREDAILEGIQDGYIQAAVVNKSAVMAYQAVLLLQAYNNFGMDKVPVTSDNKAADVSPLAELNYVGGAVITKDNVEFFLSENIPEIESDNFKS